MAVELKVPEVGESVTEVVIGEWHKSEGDHVAKDEIVVEIETDKAVLEVPCPVAGILKKIQIKQGSEAAVGDVIALIEPEGDSQEKTDDSKQTAAAPAEKKETQPEKTKAAEPKEQTQPKPSKAESKPQEKKEKPATSKKETTSQPEKEPVAPPPASTDGEEHPEFESSDRAEKRVPMSGIRRKIAARLVQAQQTAALLTTFNEIDMSQVIELRETYKQPFSEHYKVKLGFMSFFVKAVVDALKTYPALNAVIDGDDIIYRDYFDIGVAIGTERGLVVPVLKNADRMSFAEIEIKIGDFAQRANSKKLKLEELEGGTFSITNGGIYGSLLSTPIVNPPDSGVLGMHAIQQRPVVHNGEIVIRPMMYVALTYDHRMVDGREAVSFLRRIKDVIETPARMFLEI